MRPPEYNEITSRDVHHGIERTVKFCFITTLMLFFFAFLYTYLLSISKSYDVVELTCSLIERNALESCISYDMDLLTLHRLKEEYCKVFKE